MPGIESILSHIISDAEEEKQKILAEAKNKAKEIIDAANRKADEIKKDLHERACEKAEDYKRRKISMAELDFKKEILTAKQKFINDAFDNALLFLKNMDRVKYIQYLRNSIIEAVDKGDEQIIVNSNDKNIISLEFLKDINVFLNSRGINANVTLSNETADISGGFIIKSDDVEIDNSFDTLIQNLREDLEMQVAQILFKS